ncbi:AraC family transcriptional regulator [Aquimarina sp. D1M17]|uniref:helix-turn-helix domain-containing protein n=1 Tax=Aquimarina acroporae TaxID=2937283 RepID=UPI0020BD7A58|nr:AraC family transcriptional regulator [Aquimarina acroporae]MCK8520685.1 AraC family transcriptional regulator [Aquimarina acroporae]
MKFTGISEEFIYLETINITTCEVLKQVEKSALTVLWSKSDENILNIDGQEVAFKKDQIVFLTEFHHLKPIKIDKVRMLRFNRSFYCILDNDSDVGCKGVLFFGATQLPIVSISREELHKFDTVWEMFVLEINSRDKLQKESLQVMLKRFLILCVRLYAQEKQYPNEKQEINLIREYNFLIEQHFRNKHTVKEYASLLNKSPKTLSNIFARSGFKSPLFYIQQRILLEARRQLLNTDKSVKEIAYETGYEDLQTFSRFFKKHEGVSPSEYKKNLLTSAII